MQVQDMNVSVIKALRITHHLAGIKKVHKKLDKDIFVEIFCIPFKCRFKL